MALRIADREAAARHRDARTRRTRRGRRRADQALSVRLHQIEQRMVRETRQREVQIRRRRLHRVLALRRGPPGPVQLARPEAQPVRLLLRQLRLRHVVEQPPHPERHRLLRQRRGQPQKTTPPAPAPLPLRRAQRHPQLREAPRRSLRQHMMERALQLLDTLDDQLTQRPPERRRTPRAQRARRIAVDDRRPQIHIDQDDTPGRVVEQRLTQGDGPLQVDLRMHLAERAVHPRGLPVRAQHPRRLGPYENPPAVLAQQRELMNLPPGSVHRGHQPPLHIPGIRGPHRPPGEPAPPHGLLRGPAENPLRLTVPVRDRAAGVESAQGGIHPVKQRREQLRPGHRRRIVQPRALPVRLVGPQRTGGLTPGSTHPEPPGRTCPRELCTSDHSTGT